MYVGRWFDQYHIMESVLVGQGQGHSRFLYNCLQMNLLTFYLQGNAAAAQLGALNMNPAYRNLAPQQLTAAQQQQLLLQQGLNPSQLNSPQFQQLLRAGLIGGQVHIQAPSSQAHLFRKKSKYKAKF